MASTYPGGLDSFDTIASDKKTSDAVGGRTHRAMHNDLGDAIEAIETELGTDPSGGSATVKARFEAIEANDWVTAARIAADAVGSTQIAANAVGSSELADNAVDTAAIADGAVTSAKIADGTITATDVAAGTFAAFGTVGNLLTANQASGTTTLADTTGFATESAISSSADVEARTLLLLKVASESPVRFYTLPGTDGIPVVVGRTYTALVDGLDAFGSTATPYVSWFDAAGDYLSQSEGVSTVLTAGWTTLRLTVVAPATAAFACVEVRLPAGAGAHFRRLSFHQGAGGQWAMPGVPITHTGIRPNPANTAEVQIWNDATATWITV